MEPPKPDLNKLDEESVQIMVQLMFMLLEADLTVEELFKEVIYTQTVKTKVKQQRIDLMNVEDFFRVLREQGIMREDGPKTHENLQEFLHLSSQFPDLVVVKLIRKTLEQMADNEQFMDAIRQDLDQIRYSENGGYPQDTELHAIAENDS